MVSPAAVKFPAAKHAARPEREVLRRLLDLLIRKGLLGGFEGGELLTELLKTEKKDTP